MKYYFKPTYKEGFEEITNIEILKQLDNTSIVLGKEIIVKDHCIIKLTAIEMGENRILFKVGSVKHG